METTTTGDTVVRNDQLLLVLQEMQRILKRLEDHLSAQSNKASQSLKELENDLDEGDTSNRKFQVYEEDPVKNIMHPIVKLDDKLIDLRHQNTSSVFAMSIKNDGNSEAVGTETLPRSLREETPKDDPISDSNDLDIISSLDPRDLNLSDEPSEPIAPSPKLPSSTWCLLKANTLPYDDSLQWKKVRVRDNVLDPVVTSPQDWEDLKRDDGLSHWQYYKPLWYNSRKYSYTGTGRGCPSVDIELCLNNLKASETHRLVYVPYSQCATSQRTANMKYQHVNGSLSYSLPIYEKPWPNLRNNQLEKRYSQKFGGLWRIPGDSRLLLCLTSQNSGALEGLKVRFERLQSSKGFINITDIDENDRFATYSYGGPLTATAAESMHLDIGPVGPFIWLGPSASSIEAYRVACSSHDIVFRTAAWRRLIYCRNIASAFDLPLWTTPKAKEVLNLHRLHTWRTADLFQATREEHVFHISWAELDRNTPSSAQNLQTEMPIVVISYTVQPFPATYDKCWPLDRSVSKNEWTLLVLAPEGPQRKSPGMYPYGLKTNELLVATLSAILQGLTWGHQGWKEIYKKLESHLPPRDYYDKLLSNDDSLPLSIKCFWVMDRIQNVTPRLVHTAEEWSQFNQQHHVGQVVSANSRDRVAFTLLGEIQAQIAMIDELRQKFERLSKRAETTISTIFNLNSVKEARESRLLGENVKILTYATVFFLPLSFCTSMWSIEEMFNTGMKGFIIITCVLAVVTYGIVMTLLSASARKLFSQFGQKVWHWVKEVMKWFPRRFKRKNPVTDEEKTE